MRFARKIGVLAAVVTLSGIGAALAYENGHLPRSVLSRIYHPVYKLYLEKHAAASWNTMRLAFHVHHHGPLYPEGKISAYRTYAEQVEAKRLYGSNAATPGTSNHGLGLAVDLATHGMRTSIDHWGAKFGWAKKWSDASWEWWHIKYRAGIWSHPNPGISLVHPVMRKGSGGPGQASFVREIQKRLGRLGHHLKVDGHFGKATEAAVKSFQREHGLEASGVVGKKTWRALRHAHAPSKPPAPPRKK